MELYKRHRPLVLEKVIGSETTVAALKGMLAKKQIPHSILFHGPSGCGKTTLARIIKDELECHTLDFKEMNSSSYRGIDSVRDIMRVMNTAPMAGPVRVWLLDECHKLTPDAQAAALKMLEDTPEHVYFFLCTTEPEKITKPILTRCCEMPVRLLTEHELFGLCKTVAKKEKIDLDDGTAEAISAAAQGSARMALVLLDKVVVLDIPQRAAAIEAKLAEENEAIDLCRALLQKKPWKTVAGILSNLKSDPEQTRWAVLGYARVVLLREGTWQAYMVIECFKNHFYDSKAAGLAFACYEAVNAKK